MNDLIVIQAPSGSQVEEDINAVLRYEGLVRNRHRLAETDVGLYSNAERTDALLYVLHFAAMHARALTSIHSKTDLDNFHTEHG